MIMKRKCMPKTWPIARKGRMKFILRPKSSAQSSISVLVALRDLLKIVKTRKEARILVLSGQVIVNGKIVKADSFPLKFFDILTLPQIKKSFKMVVTKSHKFILEESNEKDAEYRTCKIIGKKILGKNKVQLNLDNGYNFLTEKNQRMNDSVVLHLKDNKIIKILPMEKGAMAIACSGKHLGLTGKIREITDDKTILLETKQGIIKIQIKNILVIE